MTSEEIAQAVIDALEALGIPYMLVGSFSTSFYGIPRSTKDLDIVVQVDVEAIGRFAGYLGPQFRLDPQLSFESVTLTTKQVIKVVGTLFEVELFYLSDDLHDQERFRRRQRVMSRGRDVAMPTPEDVIVTKLRWAERSRRSKDWDDICDVLSVQGNALDWDYIYHWCDRHGTRALLDEIRAAIPPI